MAMNIEYLSSDSATFLVAKGDYSASEILKAAVEQNVIDDGDFSDAEYYQSHFKATPAPKNSGFKSWHYPIEKPCKGSYFASVLQQG
ncbi:hypothetical protein [Pseudoalteromonas piratica]|nr:hypothetical protein [Pseudoalteromonas piratica]